MLEPLVDTGFRHALERARRTARLRMIYFWDENLHLYRRTTIGTFGYSDGMEVEDRLLRIVSTSNDRSTFSEELSKAITDWPSEYHLSRSRHSLIRPLNINVEHKVLELGCGCGAITRYLGETGARVCAVEGSLPRARVAAERCRGLNNVRIVVDDLLRFESDEQFDFIFLIGVLEYAAVFSAAADPFQSYLHSISRFLSPGGSVVIAIENKLGLKYFNGCSEDHVGEPYFGIQDLYGAKSPRTFGRRELVAQLSHAGLPHTRFYYPFPDYKLPAVILAEAALDDVDFDPVDLLARSHARDYSTSHLRNFDDALVWSTLHSNRLLAQFSNSFLVVATQQPPKLNDTNVLAFSYSVQRRPEFAIQTRFARDGNGITVFKETLADRDEERRVVLGNLTITHRLSDVRYQMGRQGLWKILTARAATEDVDFVVDALFPWISFLLKHATVPAANIGGPEGRRPRFASLELPGELLDCTPFNLVETKDKFVNIDVEWHSDRSVELGWVVTRGLLWSLSSGVPQSDRLPPIAEIMSKLCSKCGLSVTEREVDAWLDQEIRFQVAVTGLSFEGLRSGAIRTGKRRFTSEVVSLNQVVSTRDVQIGALEQTVAGRDSQIASLQHVISERDAQIGALEQTVAGRDSQIASLQHVISERDAQIAALEWATKEKDGRVAELNHAISEGELRIASLNELADESNLKIASLNETATQKDCQIASLSELVVENKTSLEKLQTVLVENERSHLHSEVTRLTKHAEHLQQDLGTTEARIGAISSSLSWRATSPLRAAFSRFPRIRRLTRSSLRLLWWIVSLQLTSRLRARRQLLRSKQTIAASELFDAAWYLRSYPDVATAGWDPALHYALFGAAERRNPSELFDARWYLDHNGDVAASGINPLWHYLHFGRLEGRLAHAPREEPAVEEHNAELETAASSAVKEAMTVLQTSRLSLFLSSGASLKLPCSNSPDVTIVLITYNRAELTYACLTSISECLTRSDVRIEVIILDNGSTDLTSELLNRVEGAKIIRSTENLHFLRGVNRAATQAVGRHLLFLNNDAQLLQGSLEAALRTLESAEDIGAVGARIVLLDGSLQEAGSIIWRDGTCLGYARGRRPDNAEVMFRRDVDFCSGAFLLTRRELFERLDGFDERFAPAYYEEVDYCVRLWQAGFRVVYDPEAVILHYEFASSSSSVEAIALQRRNHRIFTEKHAAWLSGRLPQSDENLLTARFARPSAKRILVIEDRVPHSKLGRGYPRSRAIVQALVDSGVEISFFPIYESGDKWVDVRPTMDGSVEVLLDRNGSDLGEFLAQRRRYFDAVLICRPHNMNTFRTALAIDPSVISGATIIYDAEAIFSTREVLRRRLAGEDVSATEMSRLLDEEVNLAKGADIVISVSAKERKLFLERGVRRVLQLGYPLTPNPTIAEFETRTDILFLGTIFDDESPNADSLRWFAQEVLPHLRERLGSHILLTVVGITQASSIEALGGSAFDLVGCVDDIRPYFEKARVVVVPTRFAAGIPLKALEAASLGVPMVVTDLIADQLGWRVGHDLLSASDGQSFAAECARLFASRELWGAIRASALERVNEDCSPARFRESVRELLSNVDHVSLWSEHGSQTPEFDDWSLECPPSATVSPQALLAEFRSFAETLFHVESRKPGSNLNYVFRSSEQLDPKKLTIKAIAFYLPQFHPIPENDLWWGKGFTEWTNTTRAVPQFLGHYQPHLPGDLGFYDLRVPDVMHQQITLARQYGISAFCFHYYWFAGKKLLERPLNQFLNDSSLDMEFCICWANENWTRRWDGSEHEVLIAQSHSPETDRAFIESVLPIFNDSRYIRIDGKPLIIIYRIDLLPRPAETIERWRATARQGGFSDIYIVAARSFDVGNLSEYGVDAAVEFPPHQTGAVSLEQSKTIINSHFEGNILDYRELAARYGRKEWQDLPTFKTVFPSWDNEARKPGRGTVFADSIPVLYANWLKDACTLTASRRKEERLVFINAWNEWAEGAHLEPDREFGYAYLHATASVLRNYYADAAVDTFVSDHNRRFVRRSNVAIIFHCFHEDVAHEIVQRYLQQHNADVDIFITVGSDVTLDCLQYLERSLENIFFVREENRGRDIRPFLKALGILGELGYDYGCKIHTKKSPYLEDGAGWRDALINPLLGSRDSVRQALRIFSLEPDLGLLVPPGSLRDLSVKDTHNGNTAWLNVLLRRLGRTDIIDTYRILFPAGSMYWFRVSALAGLEQINQDAFELEVGQRDGTLAHAIERIVGLYAWQRRYRMREGQFDIYNYLVNSEEAP